MQVELDGNLSKRLFCQTMHEVERKMDIRFTRHAEEKFKQETFVHSLSITKDIIRLTILYPDWEDVTDDGKIRAVAAISNRHSLVVIYKDLGDYSLVITFWPARRGRYER